MRWQNPADVSIEGYSMNKQKIVVISIDAMITSDLKVLKAMPECQDFFRHTAQVNEMLCVLPALTYPCHVTMLTGCYPGRHGVYHNEQFRPAEAHPDWYWYSNYTKTPSIFTYAKRRGLTTASVAWPSTSGNPDVDYLVSKIWTPEAEDEDSVNSPAVKEIYHRHKHLIEGHRTEDLDQFSLECTCDIIRTFKPDLLCTYYALIDSVRHKQGYETERHEQSLRKIGLKLAALRDACEQAGVLEDTTFVLMADHGQINTKAVFNLNVELAKRGYITLDDEGLVTDWRIFSHSCAFSAQIYCKDIPESEARRVLQEIANQYPGYLDRILNTFECDATYHITGPFSFMVEGPQGIAFGKECTGNVVSPVLQGDYKTAQATHGHSPERGPKPPFLICGPLANRGMILSEARLVDAAPTILALCGIEMPSADGIPLNQLIHKGDQKQ